MPPSRSLVSTVSEQVACPTITESAEVSRPLLYKYYPDKEALFSGVVQRLLTDWNQELVAATKGADNPLDALEAVLRECIEWATERDVLRGILFKDLDLTRKFAGPAMREGRELLPRLITQIVDQGVSAGVFRQDIAVSDMTFVITEILISGSLPAINSARGGLSPARLHAIVQTVMSGITAE